MQTATTLAIRRAIAISQPPTNSSRVRWACQLLKWASMGVRHRSCHHQRPSNRQTRPIWALHLWALLQTNLIGSLISSSPTPSEHWRISFVRDLSTCCNWHLFSILTKRAKAQVSLHLTPLQNHIECILVSDVDSEFISGLIEVFFKASLLLNSFKWVIKELWWKVECWNQRNSI